jgi:hypothetical protein
VIAEVIAYPPHVHTVPRFPLFGPDIPRRFNRRSQFDRPWRDRQPRGLVNLAVEVAANMTGSLLDSSQPLSGARDFGHSFLSRVRLSHAAEPARDCVATVTRWLLPCRLVISGGCQQWWIGPVLGDLSKWPLTLALRSSLLSAIPCNACDALKYVVMAGGSYRRRSTPRVGTIGTPNAVRAHRLLECAAA